MEDGRLRGRIERQFFHVNGEQPSSGRFGALRAARTMAS